MSASLAPTLIPNPVAIWHGAIESLSPHASPCRSLTPTRWAPMREAAIDFCDRLGVEAHQLGWTAQELFAVHPEHGTLRVEFCDVLMISGSKAVAWSQLGSCSIGAQATGPSRVGSGAFRSGRLPRRVRGDEAPTLCPERRHWLARGLHGAVVTALAACWLTGLVP
ncbi:hypothetical protein [Methylobacterium sp. J-088]|uniref:hypothetical protein n=1 Tax=Methylobacterium sp. J-088 TaxID=2836664 RepID=UPI0028C43A1C|nr:hypothetical protein [Methylobacterium sp. J-088]